MNSDDFNFIRELVKDQSGLTLTEDKAYLVENRLTPLVRKREMNSIEELVAAARSNGSGELVRDITEAMTTNESFFFRDIKPFDIFRDEIMPQLVESRCDRKSIRIWCAAASTGQEPYSIAMLLKEAASLFEGWRCEIIGTDISNEVLERARNGIYSQFEVQRGLPIQFLMKYFKQDGNEYQIDSVIRDMVDYREFNLLHDPKSLGSFDVIFCRNVLIYFDPPTKAQVLEKIGANMPADGLLFLGGAETVVGVTDKFKPVAGQRGVYAVQ